MVNRKSGLLALSCLAVLGAAIGVPARPQDALAEEYRTKVQPIVKKYCVSCHSGKEPAGSFALDKPFTSKLVAADARLWERFVFNVKSLSMPPSGPKPTDAERMVMVEWAQRALAADCDLADAGKVTIRRLNRNEYNNTVQDLLGINLDLAADFPSDDVGEGFDNIGDVLTLSPLHLEKYLSAAEKAAAAAIALPKVGSFPVDLEKTIRGEGCRVDDENGLVFFARSTAYAKLNTATPGDHKLVIEAWQQKAGTEDAELMVTLNGLRLDSFAVSAQRAKPVKVEIPLKVGAGESQIGITFQNDYYNPQDPDPNNRDRNLFVRSVTLEKSGVVNKLPNGPISALPKDDKDFDTPKGDLTRFATRAYRRPLRPAEVERLLSVYSRLRKSGAGHEQAMRDCVAAVLTSPNFLFREESASPDGALGDYELASRLSYFLWGTMPDAELFSLAAQGKLKDPKTVAAQVERMLLFEKAKNLGDDFAVQWLQLRKLENASPDPSLFPEFNAQLRQDMIAEAQKSFMEVVRSNLSVIELLETNSTFVNERLAKHYGIPGVTGEAFRKVATKDRGGLLRMAGVLTVTSNPNRTSPVKRGKWVLENVLGAPPPPPAPDVGILIDDTAIKPTLPMKERLALHRKKPECATCHTTMDAIGFSLENFDPVGKWRTKDGDFDVDSKSVLPDGKALSGADGLRKFVLARKRDFVRCLAERLLVYATGRGLRPQDTCHVTEIVEKAEKSGFKSHALIQAVVQSDPFLRRSN